MTLYRVASLCLAVAFGATGLLFLFSPDRPIAFFNSLSPMVGLPPAPPSGWGFYLILAVGYMYVVTFLALSMFRHPGNPQFPRVLAHAKLASSVLSLALFLLQDSYLIYLANCVVDGAIGIAVLVMYRKVRKV